MNYQSHTIFKKSIQSAKPSILLRNHLSVTKQNKLKIGSDVIIDLNQIKFISFGKSGGSMAKAFINIIGYENINKGIVVLPEYSKDPNIDTEKIKTIYSTHPFVSNNSVAAGNEVLEFASKCNEGEVVFCLISGGGSALLASPIDGISVKEKVELLNKLLIMGIGEREINIIRKKLSKIKGGSLAERIYPAQIINLILSDERAHQLEAIASGPTIKNKSKITAKDIINKFQLENYLPKKIKSILSENNINDINLYPKINSYIIGSREDLLKAIKNVSINKGLTSINLLQDFFDHDIIKVKNTLIKKYEAIFQKAKRGKHLVVAYGEVPIKVTSKIGKGGRNQHLAALMIEELNKYNNFEFLAIASDGCDFLNGVHGAIITHKHIEKVNSLELDVKNYIKNFNSFNLHKKIGSLIKGPMTGTNVNDFYLFYFEK